MTPRGIHVCFPVSLACGLMFTGSCGRAQGAGAGHPSEADLANAGGVVAGFELSAHTEPQVFDAGSQITVHLSLKNTTKEVLSVVDWPHPDRDFDIVVRDIKGDEAPLTQYGKKWKHRNRLVAGSEVDYDIEPGHLRNYDVYATQVYDLTEPGRYLISVSRGVLTSDDNMHFVTRWVVAKIVKVEIKSAVPVIPTSPSDRKAHPSPGESERPK